MEADLYYQSRAIRDKLALPLQLHNILHFFMFCNMRILEIT